MNQPFRENGSDLPNGTVHEQFLDGLPRPLSLLLYEYAQEQHAYVKLHRICECAEMLVRFAVVIALGEIRRTTLDGAIPLGLRPDLIGKRADWSGRLLVTGSGSWKAPSPICHGTIAYVCPSCPGSQCE